MALFLTLNVRVTVNASATTVPEVVVARNNISLQASSILLSAPFTAVFHTRSVILRYQSTVLLSRVPGPSYVKAMSRLAGIVIFIFDNMAKG